MTEQPVIGRDERQLVTGEAEFTEGDIQVTIWVDQLNSMGVDPTTFNLNIDEATLRRLETQMRWGGNLCVKTGKLTWLVPYHRIRGLSIRRMQ